MKIVAGIGSIEDYEEYVKAGADECFGGYVPGEYMLKYGRSFPANRREVIYYNVQLGSESELLILQSMMDKLGKPVSIAFNGLGYEKEQRSFIADTIRHLTDMGYKDYIAAEPELIEMLGGIKDAGVIISGELGEWNEGVVKKVCKENVKRVIFPRQTTIEEMELIGAECRKRKADIELEAFVLNEKCHYTGAYCNSLHCDELCHMCRVPYRIYDKAADCEPKDTVHREDMAEEDVVGASGCALCLLWQYRRAGITHLKVVSRGNRTEETCEDIRSLRQAIDMLEECNTEEEYIERLFKEILKDGCSKNCYTRRYSNPKKN